MMLRTKGFCAGYGRLTVIRDLDIHVSEREAVALIGPNGAGKSTFLNAVMGTLRDRSGSVTFDGAEIGNLPTHRITARGLALVPEGRRIFGPLTVEDNLSLGSIGRLRASVGTTSSLLGQVYDLFPRLKERRSQVAGTLSGGEQQMVAIGRALMAAPKMILLDEPFLGLAPKVVDEIRLSLEKLRSDGLSILLVEQKLELATQLTERLCVMVKGRIVLNTDNNDIRDRHSVDDLYFDLAGAAVRA
jgi:branched-chain amino acid transport system ATP-binding protein